MPESKILSLDEVADLCRRALLACGASELQTGPAVDSIVAAESDGIRTVGLGYLPIYCGHLQVGKLDGDAIPDHQQIAGSVIQSNANSGFAHTAFMECESDFYTLAKQQGIAALTLVNSYSAGVVGWFVERMASNGLIGLGFANSPSAVAPSPQASAFFGTNPMAFAIPRQGQAPVVADMATSQVALVTIKKHAAEGKPIPLGWGYDSDGNPTEDASAVINGGTLAPAGGYKGMLLGLLVDVLGGVLAGPNCSFEAPVFKNNTGGKPQVGQCFIAIDPSRACSVGQQGFSDRLEHMLTALTALPDVRIPGERRIRCQQKAIENGIEVPEELLNRLQAFAEANT